MSSLGTNLEWRILKKAWQRLVSNHFPFWLKKLILLSRKELEKVYTTSSLHKAGKYSSRSAAFYITTLISLSLNVISCNLFLTNLILTKLILKGIRSWVKYEWILIDTNILRDTGLYHSLFLTDWKAFFIFH